VTFLSGAGDQFAGMQSSSIGNCGQYAEISSQTGLGQDLPNFAAGGSVSSGELAVDVYLRSNTPRF
jgi:hypothetical protein